MELNKFFTDIVNNYGIALAPNKYIRAQAKIFNEKLCTTPSHAIPDVGTECFQGPPRGGGCTRAPQKVRFLAPEDVARKRLLLS